MVTPTSVPRVEATNTTPGSAKLGATPFPASKMYASPNGEALSARITGAL